MKTNRFSLFLFLFLNCTNLFAQQTSPRGGNNYNGKSMSTTSDKLPDELVGVGIDEKIGQLVDFNLQVTDETGKKVLLGSFFKKHQPVLLSPVYFDCPGLCNFHFNGVIDSLKQIDWNPGEKFQVIAFSFDASENNELATKKKINYMKMYGRPGSENGFHFLTADQDTINKLTRSIGFKFKWNETAKEWSHASAAIMISPEGKISRYLHGIEFHPQDMKLALNETASGKIGNIVDSMVLYCFKFDQHQSKYGLHVFRIVQIAGLLTILILSLWLLPVLLKARKEKV